MAQFSLLDSHPQCIMKAGLVSDSHPIASDDSTFDNMDQDVSEEHIGDSERESAVRNVNNKRSTEQHVNNKQSADAESILVPPERKPLPIPSYLSSSDNAHRSLEIEARIQQANRSLQTIRDLIADKSFHFSHSLRVTPRKGVKTRARSNIAKINLRISYHGRVYNHCRVALEKLNAGLEILEKYRHLGIEDIRTSTTLIDPNRPGSTRFKLSWIWQTGQSAGPESSEALRECM